MVFCAATPSSFLRPLPHHLHHSISYVMLLLVMWVTLCLAHPFFFLLLWAHICYAVQFKIRIKTVVIIFLFSPPCLTICFKSPICNHLEFKNLKIYNEHKGQIRKQGVMLNSVYNLKQNWVPLWICNSFHLPHLKWKGNERERYNFFNDNSRWIVLGYFFLFVIDSPFPLQYLILKTDTSDLRGNS